MDLVYLTELAALNGCGKNLPEQSQVSMTSYFPPSILDLIYLPGLAALNGCGKHLPDQSPRSIVKRREETLTFSLRSETNSFVRVQSPSRKFSSNLES